MPTVPRLTGPSVAPERMPDVQVNPGPPALGPDLSQPLGAIAGVIQQQQQRAKEAQLLDASAKLSNAETSLLYDPQTGLMNRRGEQAFTAASDAAQSWQGTATAIEQTLPSDDLKLAFRRQAQAHWDSINAAVEQHVSGEIQRTQTTAANSYIKSERDAATANYGDPDRVQLSIDRQTAAMQTLARHNGMPAEWLGEQTADIRSKTRSAVLEQYASTGQDLTAKQYLDTFRDQFAGEDLLHAEKLVRASSVRGESQRLADDITGKATSLSDALDQVKQRATDPEVRDATEERVRRFYVEQQENLRQQRAQTTTADLNTLEKAGGNLNAIPTTHWMNYTLPEREGFREYSVQLAKGLPVSTDWSTYYTLMRQAASNDPADRAKFVQTNLLQHRGELADQQFEQLTGLQNSVQKGDQAAADRLGRFRTFDQIVRSSAIQAGVIGTKDSPNDPRLTQLFRRAEEEATRLENATKKTPSSEDLQHIVDGLLLQGTIAGTSSIGRRILTLGIGGGDAERKAYQLGAGEGQRFQVSSVPYAAIPAADRADLEQRIRSAGGTITTDRVERAYAAVLNGDGEGAKKILAEK